MIKWTIKEGTLHYLFSYPSPSVYLDTWAPREFSEDVKLRQDFCSLVKSKGGTLCLTFMSFAELAKVSDPQLQAIDDLLEEVSPNLCMLEADFHSVGKKEHDFELLRRTDSHIVIDELLNKEMVRVNWENDPFKLTVRLPRVELARRLNGFNSLINATQMWVQYHRKKAADNKEYMDLVTSCKIISKLPYSSRDVIRLVCRDLIVNSTHVFLSNDAADLIHACVPVSYCDFVLLDGGWASRVSRVKDRLTQQQARLHLAKVFSKRRKGVEKFFEELSRYEESDSVRLAC